MPRYQQNSRPFGAFVPDPVTNFVESEERRRRLLASPNSRRPRASQVEIIPSSGQVAKQQQIQRSMTEAAKRGAMRVKSDPLQNNADFSRIVTRRDLTRVVPRPGIDVVPKDGRRATKAASELGVIEARLQAALAAAQQDLAQHKALEDRSTAKVRQMQGRQQWIRRGAEVLSAAGDQYHAQRSLSAPRESSTQRSQATDEFTGGLAADIVRGLFSADEISLPTPPPPPLHSPLPPLEPLEPLSQPRHPIPPEQPQVDTIPSELDELLTRGMNAVERFSSSRPQTPPSSPTPPARLLPPPSPSPPQIVCSPPRLPSPSPVTPPSEPGQGLAIPHSTPFNFPITPQFGFASQQPEAVRDTNWMQEVPVSPEPVRANVNNGTATANVNVQLHQRSSRPSVRRHRHHSHRHRRERLYQFVNPVTGEAMGAPVDSVVAQAMLAGLIAQMNGQHQTLPVACPGAQPVQQVPQPAQPSPPQTLPELASAKSTFLNEIADELSDLDVSVERVQRRIESLVSFAPPAEASADIIEAIRAQEEAHNVMQHWLAFADAVSAQPQRVSDDDLADLATQRALGDFPPSIEGQNIAIGESNQDSDQ